MKGLTHYKPKINIQYYFKAHIFNTTNNFLLFSTIAAPVRFMSTTNTRDFALGNSHMRLMPWYVTGIVDGEGSFNISISSVNRIRFEFKVTQKRLNAGILYDLERFFGVGSVVIDNRSDDTMKYHVTDRKALVNVIIPHFLNYPLVTSKKLNFISFREAR